MTTDLGTPIPRGHRIGVFEVETLLGAGGMGEVYRARDTRLGRSVAIKLLPLAFAADADRLSRFEREARVLASLNHPNIGAVYGLEPGDGITALVMELVDGDDLSTRLASGPLRMAEALAIARQIAMALEAAHEQGVVHRDLKPANIKVRPDGTVKVLDFGLAKSLQSTAAESVTVTMVTEPGLVLGTPKYMSPEQARGESVDRGADVWAFGVVLYEMMTGAAPFAGRTTAETLAHVLERRPDESRLPDDIPPAMRRLIRRCLDKDRRRRLQHIGDARIEIEDALTSEAHDGDSLPPAARTRRWLIPAVVAATALLAGVGGWWFAARDDAAGDAPVVRLTIPAIGPAFSGPNGARHLAISRDGSRIAYASTTGLLVRRLDHGEPVVVSAAGSTPFFSPDGRWLAFFGGAEGGLRKVPSAGGAVVDLVRVTDRSSGGSWGPDGTIVYATSEGLFRVSQDGGAPTLLAKPDATREERAFAWPRFMPDGRSVLFTILKNGPIDQAEVALLDLQALRRTVVLKGGTAAQYTPLGNLVYASKQQLYAVGFDPATNGIRGEPTVARDIVLANTNDNGAADFALADNGTLIFTSANSVNRQLQTLAWVNRSGREEPLPLKPDRYGYARVSPDATLIALDILGDTNRDIFVWNVAQGRQINLTVDSSYEEALPLWSIDSRRVLFGSNRAGNMDIYSQAVDGATPAELVFAGPGSQFPLAFSPDGMKLIVGHEFKDLGLVDVAHSDNLQPLLNTPFNEGVGVISPDGRWIAYESNESSDRAQIMVRPFPDVAGRREQVSIDGGRFPLWSPNSSELFFVDPNGMLISAAVTLAPTFTVGNLTPLFMTEKPPSGPSGRKYDVSRDGRFLLPKPVPRTAGDQVDINVVLNWFTELRQRAGDTSR
jgi:Tol biopolymer transport system component